MRYYYYYIHTYINGCIRGCMNSGSRQPLGTRFSAQTPQVVNSLELFEDADVSFKKEARPSPVFFFCVEGLLKTTGGSDIWRNSKDIWRNWRNHQTIRALFISRGFQDDFSKKAWVNW